MGGLRVSWRRNYGLAARSRDAFKSGYWSFDYEDGDTLVFETRRYKDGHELVIVERIRIQDGHLPYKHEITGPRGKRDERDIVFDLS
jgi:hypothetical protein